MKAGHIWALAGLLAAAGPVLAADEAPTGTVTATFEGLRSNKGMIRACLTRDPKLFLKCDKDAAAFKGNVTAGPNARIEFDKVPPGDYVLAVFHDENGNNKVDTFIAIPREGVGFSRNPAMTFGPPKWEGAKFHVAAGANPTTVKLKYFL